MNEFPYFKYQLSSKREIYICNPNIYNTNTVQFIYIYIYKIYYRECNSRNYELHNENWISYKCSYTVLTE